MHSMGISLLYQTNQIACVYLRVLKEGKSVSFFGYYIQKMGNLPIMC